MTKFYNLKTLLMMKFTVVLIVASIQVQAGMFAQTVTLSQKEASLRQVFQEIYLQTGYEFIVTSKTLATAIPVTIKAENISLDEALR